MKGIKKFKKNKLIFQIVVLTFEIILLVCLIVVAVTHSELDSAWIVILSVFGGFNLIAVILSVFFDKRRLQFVRSYYGEVSAADKEKSKDLINRIAVVKNSNYYFINDDDPAFEDFQFETKTLKYSLIQISKGYKVCRNHVGVYFDIQRAIESAPEKDFEENRDFNNYINELTSLLERNTSDI